MISPSTYAWRAAMTFKGGPCPIYPSAINSMLSGMAP